MMEIQGVSAIFIMWVLFKPLIVSLGERRCVPAATMDSGRHDKSVCVRARVCAVVYGRVIVLGLAVNFTFFLGYLLHSIILSTTDQLCIGCL